MTRSCSLTAYESVNLLRLLYWFDIFAVVSTYVALNGVRASRPAAMITAFLATFIIRSLAIAFGWSLPVFRPSSQRAADESHK